MREFYYTIKDKNGLHARPAGMLASVSKGYESSVIIYNGEKQADGKRILSIMSLGAKCGTRLRFVIDGVDEREAESSIKEYCETKLDGE